MQAGFRFRQTADNSGKEKPHVSAEELELNYAGLRESQEKREGDGESPEYWPKTEAAKEEELRREFEKNMSRAREKAPGPPNGFLGVWY